MHNKYYESRKAKTTYVLERRKYIPLDAIIERLLMKFSIKSRI